MGMNSENQTERVDRKLTHRFLVIYIISLLAGLLILHQGSLPVLNGPPSGLQPLRLPASIVCASLAARALLATRRFRLSAVSAMFGELSTERQVRTALQSLFRWPYRLFILMSTLGLIFSMLFHAVEEFRMLTSGGNPGGGWEDLLGTFAGEQSLSVMLGLYIFIFSRRLIKKLILEQQPQPQPEGLIPYASIVMPLLIAYAGTFLIAVLGLFQMLVEARESGRTVDPYVFACAACFYFAVGLFLFRIVILQFRRELRELIRRTRKLAGGEREESDLRTAEASRDEAGELAVAVNELQNRIGREYESFERELKLAYNVQEKLLPPGDLTIGSYRVAARCQQSRGVGGDFFDVLSLGSSRFAFMIGDVSGKGVPAALIMSALLLLFRAEIRRCGEPSETLERLNRQLCEAMGEEGSVSIGVGVVDITMDTVRYASAGHLSPYIVTAEGGASPVECSSLPIGFDTDAAYEQVEFALKPGDRLVLYTDGLIEAQDASGAMYSFEGLEAELGTWHRNGDLPGMVDDWLARMDGEYSSGGDDRTVVVLELAEHVRKPAVHKDGVSVNELLPNQFLHREWSLRSRLGEEREVMTELGAWIEEAWPESNIREDVQSAIAEAVVNAIEHGNKLQENARVAVVAQIGSRLTVCKIYDEGGGYFPHVSRDEEEMEKKRESADPRGWGLVLIDSLADYWSTGRDERGFFTELYFLRKTEDGFGL